MRIPLVVGVVAAAALTLPAPAASAAPPVRHFTSSQLADAKRTLDARLTAPPDGITAWGVDPTTGRVTLSVLASDAKAMAAAKAVVAGTPAATIVTVKERPRPFYNLIGGQAIYASSGGRCSVGFSARSGSTYYVITAGHCTQLGGTWSGYNRVAIGPVASSNFPTDDFGTIRVSSTGTWNPTNQVLGSSSLVSGSTEAAVGASVCRSGSTTGYRCGFVQAKNQTVNYGGGDIVYGLTRTNACAEPGDSGGSFVAGTQAQGMTSGGSGNCTSGGTTYFQPVNEALSRLGLTLVTSSTPPPPPPPPPPTPSVTLYSDNGYSGRLTTSNSSSANLGGTDVGNDALSSFRVPTGVWLSVYADVNFGGACQSFSSDVSVLAGTRIGNDTASSFKVTTSAPSGCPTT